MGQCFSVASHCGEEMSVNSRPAALQVVFNRTRGHDPKSNVQKVSSPSSGRKCPRGLGPCGWARLQVESGPRSRHAAKYHDGWPHEDVVSPGASSRPTMHPLCTHRAPSTSASARVDPACLSFRGTWEHRAWGLRQISIMPLDNTLRSASWKPEIRLDAIQMSSQEATAGLGRPGSSARERSARNAPKEGMGVCLWTVLVITPNGGQSEWIMDHGGTSS
ncbi:hypothetical protein GQ53DRAFT_166664 [Thozetella sp. PMI_491]|nr:hypothetical protein GQ53DRAFT_166664 [Thozetella sp. PMI_491]